MKRYIRIIIEVLIMLSLSGCGIKGSNGKGIFGKANKSDIVYYSYGDYDSFNPYSDTFTLSKENGVTTYTMTDCNHGEYGEMSMVVDSGIFEQIKEIYLKHKAYKWDGYSKTNTMVLDGGGFSMNMRFEDGASYRVSGSNCAPKDFYDYANEVNALFEDYNKQLLERKKNELIEAGVKGKLTSIFIYFHQNGIGKKDEYSVYTYEDGDDSNCINMRIQTSENEIFEKDSYSFSKTLKNEDLHFELIEEMVKKYDMTKWISWEEAAENYDESEWFQIKLEYEEGTIYAEGTKPPEHYEEFRSDILKYFADIIKTCEE